MAEAISVVHLYSSYNYNTTLMPACRFLIIGNSPLLDRLLFCLFLLPQQTRSSRPPVSNLHRLQLFKCRSLDGDGRAERICISKTRQTARHFLMDTLLDPLSVHPSTILAREKATVVNLEHVRCIITADESEGPALSSRRGNRNFANMLGNTADLDHLPFPLIDLEVALKDACTSLEAETVILEMEAYQHWMILCQR
ncbi:Magnesium transporter MRS2-1 [Sesamum alatum]|uniref:Magnesium transporter MRS2-1 n=1 Tax=Sesamum alatum TaxID=300844 RepID=A0AAE1XLA7_9LAMI|nr:Magnesium transporter MRS2-1 [Sesamum alatum]